MARKKESWKYTGEEKMFTYKFKTSDGDNTEYGLVENTNPFCPRRRSPVIHKRDIGKDIRVTPRVTEENKNDGVIQ